MDVELRQATMSDREKIGTFLEVSFPNRYRYPERWEWLNMRNPFITDGFGIPEWIALIDGRVVGHLGLMLVPVKIREHTSIESWAVDFIISEGLRGSGVGTKLVIAMSQEVDLLVFTLELTDVSRTVAKKIDGLEGGLTAYLLYRTNFIISSSVNQEIGSIFKERFRLNDHFISRAVNILGLSKAYCRIIKHKIQARQGNNLKALKEDSTLTLEPINRFDEQADTLWDAIRARYTFTVERTSTYLNWRYFEQPHMSHQCFYLFEKRIVKGILVVRRGKLPEEHDVGVICECYVNEPDHVMLSWLVKKAVARLTKQGVAGIWAATADREVEEIFRKLGFLQIRRTSMTMNYMDSCYDADNIFTRPLIGKGDHDWDQFPTLRQPSLGQFIKLAKQND